jgi:hypothetical protein
VPLEWTSGYCRRGSRLGRQFDCLFFFLLLYLYSFVRGTHTRRLAHSATLRVEDPLCSGLRRGRDRFLLFFFGTRYIPLGMNDALSRSKYINISTQPRIFLLKTRATETERFLAGRRFCMAQLSTLQKSDAITKLLPRPIYLHAIYHFTYM